MNQGILDLLDDNPEIARYLYQYVLQQWPGINNETKVIMAHRDQRRIELVDSEPFAKRVKYWDMLNSPSPVDFKTITVELEHFGARNLPYFVTVIMMPFFEWKRLMLQDVPELVGFDAIWKFETAYYRNSYKFIYSLFWRQMGKRFKKLHWTKKGHRTHRMMKDKDLYMGYDPKTDTFIFSPLSR